MKNIITTTLFMLAGALASFGQYITVDYDLGRNWFNEGQTMPAEQSMIIKGSLPEGMDRVEFNILSDKKDNVLYVAAGQAQSNNAFSVLVPYKLRSNEAYDFRLDFFKKISTDERAELSSKLTETLNAYIDVNISGGKKKIKLMQSGKKAVREMNEISAKVLTNYRPAIANWNPELSELVQLKLDQLEDADLDKGYSKKDTSASRSEIRNAQREKLFNELRAQVKREVQQWLSPDLYVLSTSYLVDDYRTEKKENVISLNVGYGGVYLDGGVDDLSYGDSPYLGLALPLGNSVVGSKLLGNTSLTLGMFFQNFEDEKGKEITGFLVDRPIYLGLDHKLFKFFRINAGAAFMERTTFSVDGSNSSDILVRPFVGLSARIDLNIKLGE